MQTLHQFKTRLIAKWTESVNADSPESFDTSSLYGAWEDAGDLDEIIKEIKEAGINYRDSEELR